MRTRSGLQVRTPLSRDIGAARDWERRSREAAAEKLRATPRVPLAAGMRKAKARVPPEVRERAFRRSGGACIRPGCGKPAVHLHHFLDEEHWPELAKVEANLGGTCPACNWNHHFAPGGKLPASVLPHATRRLVASIGPRARAYIARHYAPDPGGTGTRHGGPNG